MVEDRNRENEAEEANRSAQGDMIGQGADDEFIGPTLRAETWALLFRGSLNELDRVQGLHTG